MFGLNVIRKVDATTDSLLVHSIFLTIQGEGPFAGQRAVFLRLGGCSLACSWCDTEFEEGTERMPVAAIVEQLESDRGGLSDPLCVITGGEPMRQNISALVNMLLAAGWRVQVETAGVHWCIGLKFDPNLTFVCSPKTPKLNASLEAHCSDFKYIVSADEAADEDGLPFFAVSQANAPNRNHLYRPPNDGRLKRIYVQPLHLPNDEDATQRNIEHCAVLVMKYGYRLSLQQHKILNLP